MDKKNIIQEIEEQKPQEYEAYPEEMLIACQNGKPCSYGICDECPNTIGNRKEDEEND